MKLKKILFFILIFLIFVIGFIFLFHKGKSVKKHKQYHHVVVQLLKYQKILNKYKINLNLEFPKYISSIKDINFIKTLLVNIKLNKTEILKENNNIIKFNLCTLRNYNKKSIEKFLNFFQVYDYIHKQSFYYNGRLPFLYKSLKYDGLIFWNLGQNLSYSKMKNGYYNGLTVMCNTNGIPLELDYYYLYTNNTKYFIRSIFNNDSGKLENFIIKYINLKRKVNYYKNINYNNNEKLENFQIVLSRKNNTLLKIKGNIFNDIFVDFYYKYKNFIVKYNPTFGLQTFTFFIYQISPKTNKIIKGIKYLYKLNSHGNYKLISTVKINGGFID